MLECYQRDGKVKANPFYSRDWSSLNPLNFNAEILCAPGSCGREGSDIASKVRDIFSEISETFGVSRGFDYYVIPCQGPRIGKPSTRVYTAIAEENLHGLNPRPIRNLSKTTHQRWVAYEAEP